MTRFKQVGIEAVSAEGAALWYRTILPVIDSTRTLARAALREATVDNSVPRY